MISLLSTFILGVIMLYSVLLVWLRHVVNVLRGDNHHQQVASESGQGLVEYALLIVFIGVVVMALLIILGPALANMFNNIVVAMQDVQR